MFCLVGYIVGLGDRHCQNILIDCQTAEMVHIDLGRHTQVFLMKGKIVNFFIQFIYIIQMYLYKYMLYVCVYVGISVYIYMVVSL